METKHHSSKRHDRRRTARLFRNGRNQAVRLPREYEIDAQEVYIRQQGDNIILTPKPRTWDDYFKRARRLGDDFPELSEDLPAQEREPF